jgi:hypothetical protein
MEATTHPIESAPGWEQQQASEARLFDSGTGFAVPGDMREAHWHMSEDHKFLACDILRLAIAVTERTGIRVWVEWAGPPKGLVVRYYLPGQPRACEHFIWFDLDGDGECRQQLLQVRDVLANLRGLYGTA